MVQWMRKNPCWSLLGLRVLSSLSSPSSPPSYLLKSQLLTPTHSTVRQLFQNHACTVLQWIFNRLSSSERLKTVNTVESSSRDWRLHSTKMYVQTGYEMQHGLPPISSRVANIGGFGHCIPLWFISSWIFVCMSHVTLAGFEKLPPFSIVDDGLLPWARVLGFFGMYIIRGL